MATIYTVTDGVSDLLAADINQYAQALENVLGITDTQQDAVGRLVLPSSASPPASPVAGQTYRSTANGLMYIYDGANWIKQGPIRKTQSHSLGGSFNMALDPARATAFEFTFATSGGSVIVVANLQWTATKTAVSEGAVIWAELQRYNSTVGAWQNQQALVDARYTAAGQTSRGKLMVLHFLQAGFVGGDQWRVQVARDSRYASASLDQGSSLFFLEVE